MAFGRMNPIRVLLSVLFLFTFAFLWISCSISAFYVQLAICGRQAGTCPLPAPVFTFVSWWSLYGLGAAIAVMIVYGAFSCVTCICGACCSRGVGKYLEWEEERGWIVKIVFIAVGALVFFAGGGFLVGFAWRYRSAFTDLTVFQWIGGLVYTLVAFGIVLLLWLDDYIGRLLARA